MLLWSSLTLFLDSRRNDDDSARGGGNAGSDFPRGQLTSTAWEGWWHDDIAS
jgi:hypothetical protein